LFSKAAVDAAHRYARRAENDRVGARSALMQLSSGGVFVAAVACLVLLGGCETSTKFADLVGFKSNGEPTASLPAATAPTDPAATGSLASANEGQPAGSGGLLGSDPNDDLNLGKKHFRAGNFGIAEGHFRRAVEQHPRDAEAWVGLAASYDRLRRFELSDRAYKQAIEIIGPTPEVLNNQGYSYMLRGDYARARQTLRIAQAKDPSSPYIKNNLELLEKSVRTGKAIQ
jgi:tetratricopeptide (TPR) repeat protein